MKKLRLYLDCCCYYRIFDDLSHPKIRHECEAILTILNKRENGEWEIFSSDVLDDEIFRASCPIKKLKILSLYKSTAHIEINNEIVERAEELQENYGIKPFDALHLSSAEHGEADILLTTDRKFINRALASDTKIKILNPLMWLMEVLFDD